MKNFICAIVLLLCLTSCITDSKNDNSEGAGLLEQGVEAPDFTVYTADYPDGLALSELKGKYVVIEFWASWCPDCRKETENMKELYASYNSEDMIFIGFSFDTDEEAWRKYISENEMTWIQYSELIPWKESTVSTAYDVHWIPSFYLIDKEGKVAFATVTFDELKEEVEKVAKGNN